MGDKVGASEAALLNMLNVSPFSYGLVIRQGKNEAFLNFILKVCFSSN